MSKSSPDLDEVFTQKFYRFAELRWRDCRPQTETDLAMPASEVLF